MSKIKAYELMYLASNNPKRYEGKKFKIVKGHAMNNLGRKLKEDEFIYVRKGRVLFNKYYELNISQNTELKEV